MVVAQNGNSENDKRVSCASVLLDPAVSFCCNGVVHRKEGGINDCCGNVPYDSTKFSCCKTTNGFKTIHKDQVC